MCIRDRCDTVVRRTESSWCRCRSWTCRWPAVSTILGHHFGRPPLPHVAPSTACQHCRIIPFTYLSSSSSSSRGVYPKGVGTTISLIFESGGLTDKSFWVLTVFVHSDLLQWGRRRRLYDKTGRPGRNGCSTCSLLFMIRRNSRSSASSIISVSDGSLQRSFSLLSSLLLLCNYYANVFNHLCHSLHQSPNLIWSHDKEKPGCRLLWSSTLF